jgi:methylglutaconyl-CoA hydratase
MTGLRIERDGSVIRVTLAKPERRNAFDAELINELRYTFIDLEGESEARVVVLAGDGPSFCAGADVEWQRSSIDLDSEDNVEDALRLFHMLVEVNACPPPLVARVHGHALGGGVGLIACADVVVAAPDTTFGFTEVRLGIAPAVISPFVVAKIGASAARRFFVTGERFDAQTALRIGLVHEVTDDLDAAVERVVGDILKSGPAATRAAKKLARENPVDGEVLARIAAARRISVEGQEGLRAFLERRKAGWST